MFSRKFLKGSSVAVVGACLASGLQCQVTSADAYLEAEDEFGEKFYLPVNKEQAKEMLKGFCEAGLLNKGDLEEANKVLDSEQGFSLVGFLRFLIWLDFMYSSLRLAVNTVVTRNNGVIDKSMDLAMKNFKHSNTFKKVLAAYYYSYGEYSFLLRGLKFLLSKGKAFLDSFKSPVFLYMTVIVKNKNVELINQLLDENARLSEDNDRLRRKAFPNINVINN